MIYSIEGMVRKIYNDSRLYSVDEVVSRNKTPLRDFVLIRSDMNEKIYNNALGTADEAISLILEDVCRVFNINVKDVKSKSRKREYTIPRHIFFFICKHLRITTLSRIGGFTGGRDHTTVIHSCQILIDCLLIGDPIVSPYWQKYMEMGNAEITMYLPILKSKREVA